MKSGIWIPILIAICVSAEAQEDYSTWSHYKTVTINTTADTLGGGANVAGTVADFPVLVRLTASDSDAFAGAAVGGADIRFVANGARLKHQRERWDAVNRRAEFWVLHPGITGGALTTFRMYWGKPDAPDSSNGAAVFDTANGFVAVWHMNGGTGNEPDATANGLLATHSGAPSDNPTGVTGPARSFNGTNQYFTLLNSAAGPMNFHLTDRFTLSEWVNIASVPTGRNVGLGIITKGDNQWNMEAQDTAINTKAWQVEVRANGTFLYARSDGTNGTAITANSGLGQWHHLVGVFRGAPVGQSMAETLYYDGVRVRTLTANNSNNNGRNENFNVLIGAMGGGSAPGTVVSRFWSGSLDEMTVSKTVRSPDWAKLSYQTQKPGPNAVTLGSSQSTAVFGARGFDRLFVIRAQRRGSSTIFLFPPQSSAVRISVRDGRGRVLWSARAEPGAAEAAWDRDAGVRSASTGVYFVRLTTDSGEKSEALAASRFTLLR
jgi:hypothetical protein